jgi:catechol 2,3-dioxygenase-like lactoylglutathione lyase family enzyme
VIEPLGVYHMSHTVTDLEAVEKWYADVFGAYPYVRDYSEGALRNAVFFVLGNYVWEVVSTAGVENAEQGAMGKFYRRFGERLHSFSWYVDDIRATFRALKHAGLTTLDVRGRPLQSEEEIEPKVTPIFTHPKETYGGLEYMETGGTPQYRRPASAPSPAFWENEHPLGLVGVAFVTSLVKDLDGARTVYEGRFGGRVVNEERTDDHHSLFVTHGDRSVVELRSPVSGDGETAQALATNGLGSYGITFQVRDLAGALKHLDTLVDVESRAPEMARIPPAQAFGASYGFTERSAY